MPLYDFEDAETGIKLTVRRNVEDRNKDIVLKRSKSVPDTLAVLGKEPTSSERFANSVLNGYYKNEQAHGSRMNWGGFTPKQIKQAWSVPD